MDRIPWGAEVVIETRRRHSEFAHICLADDHYVRALAHQGEAGGILLRRWRVVQQITRSGGSHDALHVDIVLYRQPQPMITRLRRPVADESPGTGADPRR